MGIVAAFLGRQGRRDALRQVWIGVGVAVAICIAVGVGLQIATTRLPQAKQEGLETIVGLFAVAMVTYMILWMRKHARDLKGQLEGATAAALAQGSARALVLMAFLAVLREGFETAVFLLATFRASGNAAASATGAVLASRLQSCSATESTAVASASTCALLPRHWRGVDRPSRPDLS